MDLVSGLAVYFMVWWVVFLTILQVGAKIPEKQEKGFAASSPNNFSFKKKFWLASIITLIIWSVIYYIMDQGLITLGILNDQTITSLSLDIKKS